MLFIPFAPKGSKLNQLMTNSFPASATTPKRSKESLKNIYLKRIMKLLLRWSFMVTKDLRTM